MKAKRLLISGRVMLAFIRLDPEWVKGASLAEPLPEDAEIIDARYSGFEGSGTVELSIRSESYPEVPEGHVIPELDLLYRREE